MKLTLGLLLAVAGAVVLAAQDAQQPTFRGGARFVRVDVYPVDAGGRPVEGLTAADFEVYEDGKRQEVDSFEFVRIEPEPEERRLDPNTQADGEAQAKDPRARVFAIVLDTSHVDLAGSRELRDPLVGMLDTLIGPRDLFGVITTQLPARSFTLGRKTTTVADMMARNWTWGTHDAVLPKDLTEQLFDSCYGSVTANTESSRVTIELIARHRERLALTFLDELVDKLASIREERKAVILVTHGWRLLGPDRELLDQLTVRERGGGAPLVSDRGRIHIGTPPDKAGHGRNRNDCLAAAMPLLETDARQQHRSLMDKAQRANVAFYPLDPRGLPTFDQPISHGILPLAEERTRVSARIEGLRDLAVNTDGRAFVMNNELDEQFRQLAAGLSTYYLLGYYSTNTKFDGGYRKLTVKVKRPGVRLTARRGYIAPTEAEIAAIAEGREAADRPASAEAAELSGALARLEELRHDRDVFVQTARAGDDIIVNVEIGANARTSPAWAEGGSVRVKPVGAGDDAAVEGAIAAMRSGVSLRIPAGQGEEVRLDVRARAKQAGASAAADTTAAVGPHVPSLLGDPLAYRGIARALFPAADGRYRRTERVTIECVLAQGAVPVGVRFLDRAGAPLTTPIVTRERVDAAGVRWMVAEVSLAPFTNGDYVVELEAMKDETRERRLFAIRVVR